MLSKSVPITTPWLAKLSVVRFEADYPPRVFSVKLSFEEMVAFESPIVGRVFLFEDPRAPSRTRRWQSRS
jgi:hypothetical protein